MPPRCCAPSPRRRRGCGLPPPAALTGEWFGSRAVIVPTLTAEPVDPGEVFAVPPGDDASAIGGGWLGYLSYPDAGADGRPAHPARPPAAGRIACCAATATGSGGTKACPARRMPDWLPGSRRRSAPPAPGASTGRRPTSAAHRAGVLACLEAIAAGEVYQACVCTQFTGTLDGSPLDFFADAVARTAPARAAYLAGDWGAVASLSPELFLRRRGDR